MINSNYQEILNNKQIMLTNQEKCADKFYGLSERKNESIDLIDPNSFVPDDTDNNEDCSNDNRDIESIKDRFIDDMMPRQGSI